MCWQKSGVNRIEMGLYDLISVFKIHIIIGRQKNVLVSVLKTVPNY